jgi:hypothetical protein
MRKNVKLIKIITFYPLKTSGVIGDLTATTANSRVQELLQDQKRLQKICFLNYNIGHLV